MQTALALDMALLSYRVRKQPKLPHSFHEEVQRLSVRIIGGLQGRGVPVTGALGTDDAEAALYGVLDALKALSVSNETIAVIVNRHAEQSAAPPPFEAMRMSDRAVAQ